MNIPDILRNKWVQTTLASAVTFAGGIGIGYILGKRQGSVTVVPAEDPSKPVQLSLLSEEVVGTERLAEILSENGYRVDPPSAQEPDEATVVNIFHNPDGDWDYEAELNTRTHDQPYVIHQEEYIQDEMGYRQSTVTYYAGDDLMAEQDDSLIHNFVGKMGELRFGHGSNDPSVVYIRNEPLEMEWEVLLHTGHYAIEVLGHSIEDEYEEQELKHSVLKFRRE